MIAFDVRLEQFQHVFMVLHDLFVAPPLDARDLCHSPKLGALHFNRVFEILGLGLGKAVTELRVCADAH